MVFQQSWHEHSVPGIGVAVWESAIGMIRLLEMSPDLVRGKRVLELGCGTAAVSITCALLGAASVIGSDRDLACLELAAANVAANLKLSSDPEVRIVAHEWGSAHELGPFDLIVGADIMYDQTQFPALLKDLRGMSSDRCRIILVYPSRPESNPSSPVQPNKSAVCYGRSRVRAAECV